MVDDMGGMVWQVGRLRIQIFGFAMVGILFMISAIWYHPLTTRGGLGADSPPPAYPHRKCHWHSFADELHDIQVTAWKAACRSLLPH